jgi:hypothetical protein
MKLAPLLFTSLLALGACDGGTQGAGVTVEETAGEGAPVVEASEPAIDASTNAGAANAERPTRIPAALQGRWGLTGADCEPGRPDAKGLLTIDDRTLEFYESVGTLDAIEEARPSRIRAAFVFTGEGMTWERDIVLVVQDEGRTLIRQDRGAEAAPDPFRYMRCP